MNPTKPDGAETGEQNEQSEQPESPEGPEAPVTATQRDVMKVEGKAEQAQEAAASAKRLTIEESKDLRDQIEELQADLEQAREELVTMDKLVKGLFERAATPEGEPELNDEMPYCCPENRDDDLPVEEAMEEAGSDE
jgi:hypothetical protein